MLLKTGQRLQQGSSVEEGAICRLTYLRSSAFQFHITRDKCKNVSLLLRYWLLDDYPAGGNSNITLNSKSDHQ